MASWCYNQDFKEEEQASGSNEKKMILAVEDDKVTLSEDSGEKALTPGDLINKVLMADEGADKVTVVPEVDDKYIAYASKGKAQHSYVHPSILLSGRVGHHIILHLPGENSLGAGRT